MSADSSDIDAALVAKLGADATLLSYCPNGVYMDEAPPGMTRFVIVSLVDPQDVDVFGGRAYEDILYSIEARALSTVAGGNVKAAFARICELLDPQPAGPPATLTVTGYALMGIAREGRIPVRVEVDAGDPAIRWNKRGGFFRVQVGLV